MDSLAHDAEVTFTTGSTRDVVLVRHGETEWNREWRLQGDRDVPLNDTGRAQMAWTASRLAKALGDRTHRELPSVWTSPVSRAAESAALVRDGIGEQLGRELAPLQVEPDLREFEMGRFTGRRIMELQDDPDWQSYLADPARAVFPGGESMPAIRARACAALQRILDVDPADTLVLVSHGGIIRVLVVALRAASRLMRSASAF